MEWWTMNVGEVFLIGDQDGLIHFGDMEMGGGEESSHLPSAYVG